MSAALSLAFVANSAVVLAYTLRLGWLSQAPAPPSPQGPPGRRSSVRSRRQPSTTLALMRIRLYVGCMGAGHGHGAGPQSSSGRYVRRLAIGLSVLVIALVVEVVAGVASGSLALLSDAGHVLTDVLGMAMALAAILAARREATTRRSPQRTFGVYRAEVLAALANAVLLFGVAGWILVEAFDRLEEPPEVPGTVMLAASLFGLAANLVVFLLLRQGAKESLNVRAAYLEVLADTLGSVGVLVAGVVTVVFGWRYADPVIAVT